MTQGTIWLDVIEADTTAALYYALVMEWSTEDDAFVVSVPDFPEIHTHGATREEAAAMANEVIALTLAAA
jgi:predicted RNase H-like HicB family nuclease